jgi:pyruvate ferredoxin oxidoreductase gamma subunit
MKTLEIRWHGRGGQGTVTAAKTLGESMIETPLYFQAFPEYGPERMGAPVKAYNIISEEKILTHCPVVNPNVIVVVDPSLIYTENFLEGATEDADVILNTAKEPKLIREELKIVGRKIYTVDANKISLECLGKVIPNTPMLGALLRVTGVLSLETFLNHVKHTFMHKKFSEKIVIGNLEAIKRAYEEVKAE